jgi:hypothetical protein
MCPVCLLTSMALTVAPSRFAGGLAASAVKRLCEASSAEHDSK